jgi:ABC-2 type transport system ATP-binding protein
MNEQAVVVENLVKDFGKFRAVDHVSFEVEKGEIFGFLGANGAGKSTTIRMLCGIITPTSGSGQVAGLDINRESERIKEHIGYMSQKFSLYEDLTVEENIDFYGSIYDVPPDRLRTRKEWVLRMAGLTTRSKSLTGELAVGWKQRLALGCAMVHEPEILFLDEPTGGVDPASRRNFWELIHEVSSEGVTVFVTTHYMDEAEHCGRIAMMYAGRLIGLGSPSQLKTEFVAGTLLEVRTHRVMETLQVLDNLPQIKESAVFGSVLHTLTDSPDNIPAIIKGLQAAGIADLEVEQIIPSLEDVFVAMIEKAEKEAG